MTKKRLRNQEKEVNEVEVCQLNASDVTAIETEVVGGRRAEGVGEGPKVTTTKMTSTEKETENT